MDVVEETDEKREKENRWMKKGATEEIGRDRIEEMVCFFFFKQKTAYEIHQ